MSENYETKARAILRGAQFGWNEYEGVRQPQLVCRFEMLDGDDVGKHETWFASLSDDVNSKGRSFYEYTIDGLRTCGWTGTDLSEVPKMLEAGEINNEVIIVREHKLKGEKWRSSVKYVNSLGGGAKVDLKENAMTEDEVAQFAKRMKAKLGGGAKATGNQARSPAPPRPNGRKPAADQFDDRDAPPPSDDDYFR